jgi:tetratricopeptide (TPR) repeat protein
MSVIGKHRRRLAWSIAVLVALAGLGAAAARFGPAAVERPLGGLFRPAPTGLAAAQAAYARGEWGRAAELARPLLKTMGDDPEALRVYARASARLKRDAIAGAIYNGRLGAARMQAEDHFLVGLAFERLGQREAALQVFEKAAQNGQDSAELLYHLVWLSAGLQRLDQAADAARRLARQPGWEGRGQLLFGEIQALLDDPSGAAGALAEGLKLDPSAGGIPFGDAAGIPEGAAHFQNLLGRTLLWLGRPGEAEKPMAAATAKAGTTDLGQEANWLLSRAYLQEGRLALASGALARAGSYRARYPFMAEPSPYVGAARCAPCHAEISRAYGRTRHARTFHRGQELLELPLPEGPLPDPDNPRVTHAFRHDGERVELKTHSGQEVYRTIIEYAFGTRERYVTMIGRDQEHKYRAARLSYHRNSAGSGWCRTFGEPKPDEIVKGQTIAVQDGVVRCLYCHVTRSRDFRDPPPEGGMGPEAADSAIGCERCHGPGGNHVAAIAADFPDRAIASAGSSARPAASIDVLCAQCHIVGSRSDIESAPDDPRYVRSTVATFEASRCFTESEGRMGCLTCHDPHRDAERSAAFYEAKCLSCHSGERKPKQGVRDAAFPAPAGRQASCPINPVKDCLNCHMPKVAVAVLQRSLTDHYIRVRKEQAP